MSKFVINDVGEQGVSISNFPIISAPLNLPKDDIPTLISELNLFVAGSKSPDLAPIEEIFDYWVEVMEKKATTTLTRKRKDKITLRLKDGYSVDFIKCAISNCSNSIFHMGRNDNGTKYNDIELICRSADKLEDFHDNVATLEPPPEKKSSKNSIEDWLNNRGDTPDIDMTSLTPERLDNETEG